MRNSVVAPSPPPFHVLRILGRSGAKSPNSLHTRSHLKVLSGKKPKSSHLARRQRWLWASQMVKTTSWPGSHLESVGFKAWGLEFDVFW